MGSVSKYKNVCFSEDITCLDILSEENDSIKRFKIVNFQRLHVRFFKLKTCMQFLFDNSNRSSFKLPLIVHI